MKESYGAVPLSPYGSHATSIKIFRRTRWHERDRSGSLQTFVSDKSKEAMSSRHDRSENFPTHVSPPF